VPASIERGKFGFVSRKQSEPKGATGLLTSRPAPIIPAGDLPNGFDQLNEANGSANVSASFASVMISSRAGQTTAAANRCRRLRAIFSGTPLMRSIASTMSVKRGMRDRATIKTRGRPLPLSLYMASLLCRSIGTSFIGHSILAIFGMYCFRDSALTLRGNRGCALKRPCPP
jgi:hypothetical protein